MSIPNVPLIRIFRSATSDLVPFSHEQRSSAYAIPKSYMYEAIMASYRIPIITPRRASCSTTAREEQRTNMKRFEQLFVSNYPKLLTKSPCLQRVTHRPNKPSVKASLPPESVPRLNQQRCTTKPRPNRRHRCQPPSARRSFVSLPLTPVKIKATQSLTITSRTRFGQSLLALSCQKNHFRLASLNHRQRTQVSRLLRRSDTRF